MPTKRTRRARHLRVGLSEFQIAYLFGDDLPKPTETDNWWRICEADRDDMSLAPTFATSARALWTANRDALMELWLADNPGRRPSAWWKYDAPRQPIGTFPGCYYDARHPVERQRLGGKGSPKHEFLAHVPYFPFGIPWLWITAADVEFWPDLPSDGAEAYDPADPPLYEAEASYLERHGLFLPGERQRLAKADFEPEPVVMDAG